MLFLFSATLTQCPEHYRFDDRNLHTFSRIQQCISTNQTWFSAHISDATSPDAVGFLGNLTRYPKANFTGLSLYNATHQTLEQIANGPNEHLETLNIQGSNLGNKGAKRMGELLNIFPKLKSSFLGFKMDGEGAGYLANALKHNKTLESLNLSTNPIGDDGVCKIAKNLEFHPKLKDLTLVNCEFGDSGAECLANTFRQNRTMQNLYLWHNNISESGKKLFCSLLPRRSNRQVII